ncbi:hypothetical protein JAAARDRAFT_188853 [Jaapia argillacea MUCL 33604]|uniref:Homeobox domain-containing protein n=1 Tax=Jaapia argillacea MUCL 33604 TaxID=933084 RepID=A0A067QKW1_9AGAM|nr:hypothetical protein JAAARDRAFT_188853 [Jaapia argillacea MUCL 33604]
MSSRRKGDRRPSSDALALPTVSRKPGQPTNENFDNRVPGALSTPAPSRLRSKKARHRMTDVQFQRLATTFETVTHPSRREKEALADELGMEFKTVNIWFQNKRQTSKRNSGDLPGIENGHDETCDNRTITSSNSPLQPEPLRDTTGDFVQECFDSAQPTFTPIGPRPTLRLPLTPVRPSRFKNVTMNAYEDCDLPARLFSTGKDAPPPINVVQQERVEPADLWKWLSSSPVASGSGDPPCEPARGSPRSTNNQSNMLERACERLSKRRRENDFDDSDIDDVHQPETYGKSELRETEGRPPNERAEPMLMGSLSSAVIIPREYSIIFDEDVVTGAALLIQLKHSIKARK